MTLITHWYALDQNAESLELQNKIADRTSNWLWPYWEENQSNDWNVWERITSGSSIEEGGSVIKQKYSSFYDFKNR